MRQHLSIAIRLSRWVAFLFTAGALIVIYTPVANLMARPLIVKERLIKSDVIVVLGGGAYENGVLGAASNERLIRGLLLYKDGLAPRIIFSGGTINGASAKVIHTLTASSGHNGMDAVEASIMADTAARLGIPQDVIDVDISSTNTYENLKAGATYMKTNNLKTCLLVTSSTHMLRSMLVSKKLGMDCAPAPVADYTRLRRSSIDRLSLFHAVTWEYAGLALYRVYGYI